MNIPQPNTNTSASGGYLLPTPVFPVLPGNLSFKQFIQTVLAGVSGVEGDLIRPKWQINPPKQPDIFVNWIAFALVQNKADPNMFTGEDNLGNNFAQRMEDLEVQCSFYGPQSDDIASLTRDGFQIPQNLEALKSAGMGFVSTNAMMHVPDLVNERWIDRYEMSFFFRREILRFYPVLYLLSAKGIIESIVSENLKIIPWDSTRGGG